MTTPRSMCGSTARSAMTDTSSIKEIFYYSQSHADLLKARLQIGNCRTADGSIAQYTSRFYHHPKNSVLNKFTGYDDYPAYRKKSLAMHSDIVNLGECVVID